MTEINNNETINNMFNYDPEFDVMVYGHTHYPVIWVHDNKKIINPGSVGQPRDRKPGASWVFWDTTTNQFDFHREKYDATPVINMCRENDPNINYLVDVLVRK